MTRFEPSIPRVARAPSAWSKSVDRTFRLGTQVLAWSVAALVFVLVVSVAWGAWPAITEHGFDFLTYTGRWNPSANELGIVPQLWGTVYSSFLALLVGGTLGLAVAIFLSQDFLPGWLEHAIKNLVELLAAIPSVVYGLWGLTAVLPWLNGVVKWLSDNAGWFPLFRAGEDGLAATYMLPAALVLAVMILPTMAAVSRDALVSVPRRLKEGAYGLGATRWEVIFRVVLPTASTGIFGAIVLALGRALGETMALAMLVGGVDTITVSLFSPANTLAAMLANQFPEAGRDERGALMYAALVLLSLTLLVNVVGAALVSRLSVHQQGGR